jgi:hypothetical protein
MNIFARVLKDCLTIANDKDYCYAKVGAFIGLVVYLPTGEYMLYKVPEHFSLSEFAIGIATILGAGAVAARVKKDVEPQ